MAWSLSEGTLGLCAPSQLRCLCWNPCDNRRERDFISRAIPYSVGKKVIEIPAGLVGDEPEFQGESFAETAGRELLEETGYRAGRIGLLISSPTSAGMTPEITHLFYATHLTQENEGGGNAGEDIEVYKVPLTELRDFLSNKQSEGLMVDFKIHAALAAAGLGF